jgi:hypothetical protein
MKEKRDQIKENVKTKLEIFDSSICIEMDFWSSNANQAYLGVIYSLIDNNLSTEKGLLALQYFPGKFFFCSNKFNKFIRGSYRSTSV